MSKVKEPIGLIPAIYRKSYEDIGLFFWIEAQRHLLPTLTIIDSIQRYFDFIGIDWDYSCAEITYQRLKKEYDAIAKKNTGLNK